MSEAVYPEWPSPSWPSREAAIAQAVSELEPGDHVVAHQSTCAMARDEECDCRPAIVLVGGATV